MRFWHRLFGPPDPKEVPHITKVGDTLIGFLVMSATYDSLHCAMRSGDLERLSGKIEALTEKSVKLYGEWYALGSGPGCIIIHEVIPGATD